MIRLAANRVADAARLSVRDKLILAVLFLFLTLEIFQGVLRYYLTVTGMPLLIYLPKLLMSTAFVALALETVRTFQIRRTVFGAAMLFIAFLLVGLFYTQSVVQPLFGAFALLPLLFAVLAEPAVSRLGERLLPFSAVLWISAAAGVVYDYVSEVPWSGLRYELGGLEVVGSRAWTTFGIERVAGFSRASFEVADQLLYLALACVILGRRKGLAFLIWGATGALIALTTTKRTAIVYLLLTLLLPAMRGGLGPKKLRRALAATLPIVVVLVGIGLPLSTLLVQYRLDLDSFMSKFLFASFEERLTWTWPEGLSLVFRHGSILLGRGLGGIGVAQKYFEPELYAFADNLYLYLYATFGFVGLWLVGVYAAGICRLSMIRERWSQLMWFLAVAALMGGWTVDGVEGAFTSVILGLTLAYVMRKRRRAGSAPAFMVTKGADSSLGAAPTKPTEVYFR